MRNNQAEALRLVLAHEGGYVNHPKDPGGATNKGITQAVYDAYRRSRHLEERSVRFIEDREVHEIYDEQYWDTIKGDRLPAGVDYAMFDYSVNSGSNRAVKDMQRTVGAPVDGVMGNVTLAKIEEACARDEEGLIADYCNRRMRFLRALKTFRTFGRGWSRRVMGDHDGFQTTDYGVIDYAIMMARNDTAYPLPTPTTIGVKRGEVAGKALEQDVAKTKTKGGIGAALTSSGVSGQTLMSAADQVRPQTSEGPLGMAATIIFLLLTLAGVGLIAWTVYQKTQEAKV